MKTTTAETTVEAHERTTKVMAAFLGYAKIKVINPDIELKFGEFNPREINKTELTKLRGSFESKGIQWWSIDNAMPLIIPKRSLIDPSTVTMDVAVGMRLPTLALSGEGQEAVKKFDMASGQHRVKVVRDVHIDHMMNVSAMRDAKEKIEKLKQNHERSMEIERLSREIESEETFIEGLGYWCVRIFDRGTHIFHCHIVPIIFVLTTSNLQRI